MIGAREGHALLELVVALPLLAIGGAAIAGTLLVGSVLLVEAERRLEAAARGVSLLDSLRAEAAGGPAQGAFDAAGRSVGWSWDGDARLTLVIDPEGEGEGEVRWTLGGRSRGSSGGPP